MTCAMARRLVQVKTPSEAKGKPMDWAEPAGHAAAARKLTALAAAKKPCLKTVSQTQTTSSCEQRWILEQRSILHCRWAEYADVKNIAPKEEMEDDFSSDPGQYKIPIKTYDGESTKTFLIAPAVQDAPSEPLTVPNKRLNLPKTTSGKN